MEKFQNNYPKSSIELLVVYSIRISLSIIKFLSKLIVNNVSIMYYKIKDLNLVFIFFSLENVHSKVVVI